MLFLLKFLDYSYCISSEDNIKCKYLCSEINNKKLIITNGYQMEGEKRIEKYQFNLKNVVGSGSYATVYKGKVIGTND